MKRAIILFILVVLIAPPSFSLSLDAKQMYQPGETMIAKITGEILEPISKDKVKLVKEGTNNPVGFEYDVKRLGENYFIWGILPLNTQTTSYTLTIDDISTTINGVPNKTSIKQNIILNGSTIRYTINPGFIISEKEFSMVFILNDDLSQTIQTSFPQRETINLFPGENKITFGISNLNEGFQIVNFGIYDVPMYISRNYNPRLVFLPSLLSSTLLVSKPEPLRFIIINSGNVDLNNVTLSYDNKKFILYPERIEFLGVNKTLEINLSVKNTGSYLEDNIIAKFGNVSFNLPIKINFTTNKSQVLIPKINATKLTGYYCSELKGKSCSPSQECTGQIVESIDIKNCCLASCEEQKTSSSFSWAGYLIIGLVLIVLVIIGGRYLKSRKHGSGDIGSLIKKN